MPKLVKMIGLMAFLCPFSGSSYSNEPLTIWEINLADPIQDVTVDKDGFVYAATGGFGNEVQKFDKFGNHVFQATVILLREWLWTKMAMCIQFHQEVSPSHMSTVSCIKLILPGIRFGLTLRIVAP